MITLRRAENRDRVLLGNMFNLMHAELKQYTREIGDMDEHGYFDASASDAYFADEDCAQGYVIMSDELICGIITMTSAPYVKPGCGYCLQELYVMPHLRGQGIGSAACKALFSAYPGRWCCIVLTGNVHGMKFAQDVLLDGNIFVSRGQLDDESIFIEFEVSG